MNWVSKINGFHPLLSPSNILSHRKVPFQKMPPPPPSHGKILKKGPDEWGVWGVLPHKIIEI
jgi:hypothetical protein